MVRVLVVLVGTPLAPFDRRLAVAVDGSAGPHRAGSFHQGPDFSAAAVLSPPTGSAPRASFWVPGAPTAPGEGGVVSFMGGPVDLDFRSESLGVSCRFDLPNFAPSELVPDLPHPRGKPTKRDGLTKPGSEVASGVMPTSDDLPFPTPVRSGRPGAIP